MVCLHELYFIREVVDLVSERVTPYFHIYIHFATVILTIFLTLRIHIKCRVHKTYTIQAHMLIIIILKLTTTIMPHIIIDFLVQCQMQIMLTQFRI